MWFRCRPSMFPSMITVYSAAAPIYASSLLSETEQPGKKNPVRTQWVTIPYRSNNPEKIAGAEFSCYTP